MMLSPRFFHQTLLAACATTMLAGCSGAADLPPDEVLQKVHEHYAGIIQRKLDGMDTAKKYLSSFDFRLATVKNQVSVPVEGEIHFGMATKADTGETGPAMEWVLAASTDLRMDSGGPEGEMRLQADAETTARLIKDMLYLRIGNASVDGKSLGITIDVPKGMIGQWFGSSITDLAAKTDPVHRDQLMAIKTRYAGSDDTIKRTREEFAAFAKEVHIWKVLGTKPSEHGQLRIEVVSDPEKLRHALRAYADFMSTIQSPDGGMLVDTADMQASMNEVITHIGTVYGVLSIDPDTYAVTGFDGTVTNENATSVTSIFYEQTGGDLTLRVSNPTDDKPDVSFEKKGEGFRIFSDGQLSADGMISRKHFLLTTRDAQGSPAITADFDVDTFSPTSMHANGTVTMVGAPYDIRIDDVHYDFTNNFKDAEFLLHGDVRENGTSFLSIDATGSKKEVADVTVDTPAKYKPLEELEKLMPGIASPFAEQVSSARDAQRRSDVNTLLNAIYQYAIDNNGVLPPGITAKPKEICHKGPACKGMMNLDVLLGAYMVAIPQDPGAATSSPGTRYFIMKDVNGRVTVSAPDAEGGTPISVTR